MVPRAVVRKVGLEVGDDIEQDLLEGQLARVEPALARERALYLLSGRERSTAELRSKLLDDGFEESVARDVIADLADRGLVDDARFAEALSRSLVNGRGYGRERVARELARHGVDPDLAHNALEEACPRDDEYVRALETARRMSRGRVLDVGRLASRLARKGFTVTLSFAAARDALDGTDPDAPDPDAP